MAISTLATTVQTQFKWTAGNTLTGSLYNQVQNVGSITKQYNIGTAAANSASGGSDEVFSFQQSIALSSSATISLIAMTNLLSQASVAIVRIKAMQIRLLSTTDDTGTGTACTQVLVTNMTPELPAPMFWGNGGTGLTVTLTAGAGIVTAVAIGAAGSGYPVSSRFIASPQQSGGSGCFFMVTTDASGIPTAVTFITGAGGTGYSNATVPTTPVGSQVINNGGTLMYFDPLAAGFMITSATAKNFTIVNRSASTAATVEIDVVGATS